MKLVPKLLFIGLSAFIYADSNVRNPVDNERYARIILDNARFNFHCGFPHIGEYGIPPLDPMYVQEFNVSQRSMGVDVVSTLSNTFMRGLRHFIIQKFSFNPDQTVEYIFATDYLALNGDHWTRGSMVGLPVVNGQGRMAAEQFNNLYHGFVRWSTQPDTGFIYPISHTVTVSIQHMIMQMSGFGPLINGTVNQQINDMIPDMLVSPEFQQQMNDMLDTIIIPLFEAVTYRQTVDTITGHLAFLASNPSPPSC
ncbi:uncharacterized protein [Chironomus tepperi]|uniref:uncharacterized protein n=1 Tax=Chironomus tepperi TaxID=113505 RepID=UPI00391FC522